MSSTNVGGTDITVKLHKYKKQSQMKAVAKRFTRNKLGMIGLVVFLTMAIAAIVAPLFIDYINDVVSQHISERYQSASMQHLFGTDQFGRDIFYRVLWGARISMSVGLGVVLISLSVGTVFGALSGYFGNLIDDIIMRMMDILLAIPGTMLAVVIVAAMGNSIPNLLLALSVEQIPKMSRIVRASVMGIGGQEYIEAAKACGTSNFRIITKHILPNCIGPIIVQSTMTIARTIISIAGLSFIGLGMTPPSPEWGAMLSEAKTQLLNYPYLVMAPGVAIVMTVTSLTLVGDGLRDALDPKLKN